MVMLANLVQELKALRRGRGLFASQISERVGPAVRVVSGVTDEDGHAVVRQKVFHYLENLADDLPTDLRLAVLAAFAISPDARMRFYQDRVSWAAIRLDRDPRTARRRIDDGIAQLAQRAVSEPAGPRRASADLAAGWRTAELRVVLALDRPLPQALEQRKIVSHRDGLDALDLATPSVEDVDLLYGGTLLRRGRGCAVAPPRALARGDAHDFALQYRLPDARTRSHVCVPQQACDVFDLRVRFDRARPPRRVWLLRGVVNQDEQAEPWAVDEAGEVHVTFRNLVPGLAYGARWEP